MYRRPNESGQNRYFSTYDLITDAISINFKALNEMEAYTPTLYYLSIFSLLVRIMLLNPIWSLSRAFFYKEMP